LKNDPITITLDGVVHNYHHVNIFSLPSTKKLAMRAINLMKTPADFKNLPRLLSGLVKAKRSLPPEAYCQIIRLAGKYDHLAMMIELARRGKTTGFWLDTHQKALELMLCLQEKAFNSGWDKAQTKSALTSANVLLELLEQPDQRKSHRRLVPGHPPAKKPFPLFKDPLVIAGRLHLAAAFAVKHNEGKDAGGKVEAYATELIQLWKDPSAGVFGVYPATAYKKNEVADYLKEPSKIVVFGAPIIHGLDMAMKVVDEDLAQQLRARRDAVAAEVDAGRAAGKVSPRGTNAYQKLLASSTVTEAIREAAQEAEQAATT
jgi:hypothetical protein